MKQSVSRPENLLWLFSGEPVLQTMSGIIVESQRSKQERFSLIKIMSVVFYCLAWFCVDEDVDEGADGNRGITFLMIVNF